MITTRLTRVTQGSPKRQSPVKHSPILSSSHPKQSPPLPLSFLASPKSPPKPKKVKALSKTQELEHALAAADDPFTRWSVIDEINIFIRYDKNGGTLKLENYELTSEEIEFLTDGLCVRLLADAAFEPIKITPVQIELEAARRYAEKQKKFAAEATQQMQAMETPREKPSDKDARKEAKQTVTIKSRLDDGEKPEVIAKEVLGKIINAQSDGLRLEVAGPFTRVIFPEKSTPAIDEIIAIYKQLSINLRLGDCMIVSEGDLTAKIGNLSEKFREIERARKEGSDAAMARRLQEERENAKLREMMRMAEQEERRKKSIEDKKQVEVDLAERERQKVGELRAALESKARMEERFKASVEADRLREQGAEKTTARLKAQQEAESVRRRSLSPLPSPVGDQMDRLFRRRNEEEKRKQAAHRRSKSGIDNSPGEKELPGKVLTPLERMTRSVLREDDAISIAVARLTPRSVE